MFDTSARSKGFARKKVNNPAFDAGKVFEAGPVALLYSQDSPCRSVGFSGFFSQKPTVIVVTAGAVGQVAERG